MRNLLLLSVCVGAFTGLAACAEHVDAPLSPVYGRAFASMQSQVIPTVVSTLPPETSGAAAAAAIGRYDKGQVKPPQTSNTSTLVGVAQPTQGNQGK